jgi:hypothetical protein
MCVSKTTFDSVLILMIYFFFEKCILPFCACNLLDLLMLVINPLARMGEERGVHRVLVGKPEGKRPLGRPRRSWENNIKMDVQEVGGGRGDWMELAQDRDRWRALVSTVKNLRVP